MSPCALALHGCGPSCGLLAVVAQCTDSGGCLRRGKHEAWEFSTETEVYPPEMSMRFAQCLCESSGAAKSNGVRPTPVISPPDLHHSFCWRCTYGGDAEHRCGDLHRCAECPKALHKGCMRLDAPPTDDDDDDGVWACHYCETRKSIRGPLFNA